MYEQFFGFKQKPFEVTPDPRFLYMTPDCREILSALLYGVTERRGFIAIVGEVGTGKTLLLNAMLDRLDSSNKVAVIYNSDLTFTQMLMMILVDLELARPEKKLSKADAIQRLNYFAISQLQKGGNVVIVIDEAQNLGHRTMENLRMLSNLETRQHKLVQIILCGQPELDDKLKQPDWRQLVQRISLKRYSTTLDQENTLNYVQYRLEIAGCKDANIFSPGAQKLIYGYSQGTPRKINILCDNALLITYATGSKTVSSSSIEEAAADLCWPLFAELLKKEDEAEELVEDAQETFNSVIAEEPVEDAQETVNLVIAEEPERQEENEDEKKISWRRRVLFGK